MLIDAGASLDALNLQDSTPLMWYIRSFQKQSDPTIVKLLCGREWINARAYDDCTALTYALKYTKSLEIIKVLLDYGADPNCPDDWGLLFPASSFIPPLSLDKDYLAGIDE